MLHLHNRFSLLNGFLSLNGSFVGAYTDLGFRVQRLQWLIPITWFLPFIIMEELLNSFAPQFRMRGVTRPFSHRSIQQILAFCPMLSPSSVGCLKIMIKDVSTMTQNSNQPLASGKLVLLSPIPFLSPQWMEGGLEIWYQLKYVL